MKKFRLLSAFFIILSAINFTSCDSEPVDSALVGDGDTDGSNTPAGPAVFKADFNGQTFIATQARATRTEALMTIQGIKGTNGEMFSIAIEGTTTGVYNNALIAYAPNNASDFMYLNINSELNNNEENGTVNITSINTANKTISGTFNFTGYWSDVDAMLPPIVFTNGSFTNVPYTDPTTPGTGTTDYLKANVDGQALDYSNNLISIVSEGPNSIISINGFTSESNKLNLFIKENLPVGTYVITTNFTGNVRAEVINASGEFEATSGTLTISAKQGDKITGTFVFNAGEIEVTNGLFSIDYSSE